MKANTPPLNSQSEPSWPPLKANNNLINIWKYLLRSNRRNCLPFLSPCDVGGVTQRYSRGGDSPCWNGWWQGFHPTHWGLFVVILGSLMGAIWESSRQTGLISEQAHIHTHTGRNSQAPKKFYDMLTIMSIKLADAMCAYGSIKSINSQ